MVNELKNTLFLYIITELTYNMNSNKARTQESKRRLFDRLFDMSSAMIFT